MRFGKADGVFTDLIECGPYVTGANFSGVRPRLEGLVDLGFPIAEIANDGTAIITKHPSAAGFVDELNVRAQFLYEIQGTQYINPDVLADIENIKIGNSGKKDRVHVSGAVGSPPPPTTKAITVAMGGYQAEATFYMNGLDIEAKEKFMRQQLEHAFRNSNFSELSIERYGSAAVNPSNQALGTVFFRVLVKGKTKEDIAEDVFRKHVYAMRMQFYAGEFDLHIQLCMWEPTLMPFPAKGITCRWSCCQTKSSRLRITGKLHHHQAKDQALRQRKQRRWRALVRQDRYLSELLRMPVQGTKVTIAMLASSYAARRSIDGCNLS